MSTKLPVRRVNPVRIQRDDAARLQRRTNALPAYAEPRRSPNWWAIIPMLLVIVYAMVTTGKWLDAEIAQARAEAMAEVQAEVIEDLRQDRDNRTEHQSQGKSLGDLIYSFFTGIFTILNVIVGALVDLAEERPAS